jgi:hypothetical protein
MLHTYYGRTITQGTRGAGRFGLRFSYNIRLSSTAIHRAKKEAVGSPIESKESQISPQAPLSRMPFRMLMRSLLVATISSNRFLLIPSLHVLSFLSKPDRTFLLSIDRNPLLKAIVKKSFYDQFCAGTTETETRACVRQLKDLGFRGVILTYAQELVFDHRSQSSHSPANAAKAASREGTGIRIDNVIESWKVGTLKTMDLISEGDILAIKYVRPNHGYPDIVLTCTVEHQELESPWSMLSPKENCHHNR